MTLEYSVLTFISTVVTVGNGSGIEAASDIRAFTLRHFRVQAGRAF